MSRALGGRGRSGGRGRDGGRGKPRPYIEAPTFPWPACLSKPRGGATPFGELRAVGAEERAGRGGACLAAMLLLCASACLAGEGASLSGYSLRSSATLPLDGSAVATAPLAARKTHDYILSVRGSVRCALSDVALDARTADSRGRMLIRIEPELDPLGAGAREAEWLWRIPPEVLEGGKSVSVGLDVPRLVDQYLVTPSEVRAALSGEVTVELWERKPPFPWRATGTVATALGAFGIVAVLAVRRVRDPYARPLRSIRRLHRQATREAGREFALFRDVLVQLDALRDAAEGVAAEGWTAARGAGGRDPEAVRRTIAGLEARLERAVGTTAREQLEAALRARSAELEVVEGMRARAESAAARLLKVEGILAEQVARIREARVLLVDRQDEDAALTSLADDVALVRKAIADVTGG